MLRGLYLRYISISLWSYSIKPLKYLKYLKIMYFNFIMILFYYDHFVYPLVPISIFQFHYDLILLLHITVIVSLSFRFQFHYDLILFDVLVLKEWKVYIISISLWSYSIKNMVIGVLQLWVDFNFIMILFYYSSHLFIIVWQYSFQFHYDLILLNNYIPATDNLAYISISLWSYSIIAPE